MHDIAKDWFVSSHCGANNSCVETRIHTNGTVEVRNSTDREAGTATFAGPEWDAFVTGVKAGEFDVA